MNKISHIFSLNAMRFKLSAWLKYILTTNILRGPVTKNSFETFSADYINPDQM